VELATQNSHAGEYFRDTSGDNAAPARPLDAAHLKNDSGGQLMSRLRTLVLGPDCHPEQVSIPYVTYSHAAALAQLHDVTLVVRSTVEDDVRRAGSVRPSGAVKHGARATSILVVRRGTDRRASCIL
jgi:hypothetical protein